ncbi:hypothetical protein ACFSHP_20265 [Novosphingobium panipatense]
MQGRPGLALGGSELLPQLLQIRSDKGLVLALLEGHHCLVELAGDMVPQLFQHGEIRRGAIAEAFGQFSPWRSRAVRFASSVALQAAMSCFSRFSAERSRRSRLMLSSLSS